MTQDLAREDPNNAITPSPAEYTLDWMAATIADVAWSNNCSTSGVDALRSSLANTPWFCLNGSISMWKTTRVPRVRTECCTTPVTNQYERSITRIEVCLIFGSRLRVYSLHVHTGHTAVSSYSRIGRPPIQRCKNYIKRLIGASVRMYGHHIKRYREVA